MKFSSFFASLKRGRIASDGGQKCPHVRAGCAVRTITAPRVFCLMEFPPRNPAPTRTRAGFSFWQMMRRLPEPNAACIIEWVFDNPDEPLIVCHASPQQQIQFEWTRAGSDQATFAVIAHSPVMALLGHRKSAGLTPAFEQGGH